MPLAGGEGAVTNGTVIVTWHCYTLRLHGITRQGAMLYMPVVDTVSIGGKAI